MVYIKRQIEKDINDALARDKSVLLFGARQTGKTTLINQINAGDYFSFAQPAVRQLYEKNPSLLINKIESLKKTENFLPLVIIDEVQKVPDVLDVIQDLIDRKIAKFILTGSSARKLKQHRLNLLPGRVVILTLTPLMVSELPQEKLVLDDLLVFGSLPGIVNLENPETRKVDLYSYVTTYLEEEIRAEAAVRNVAAFARFLELAAAESGNLMNFNKLSQEIGVAHTTIMAYYQILEDCLVAEKVEPYTQSKTRRRLIKTPKYLFSDLGIRCFAARESPNLPLEYLGRIFEQFIGLELMRLAKFTYGASKIYFWHDANGPEVDWVIVNNQEIIPIEVKWTANPTLKDARYLQLFCEEYDNINYAYIICRAPFRIKLTDKIFALPWQEVSSLIVV